MNSNNAFDVAEKLFQKQQSVEEKTNNAFDVAERKLKEPPRPFEKFSEENELERIHERHQARATSRVLETIAGAPGDLRDFLRSAFPSDKGLYQQHPFAKILPTSEELKKFSEEQTHGYTKAETPAEEITDEFIQDIAAFASPGAKKYNIARNIGIPLVANLAKEGVKYLGFDDKWQAATKTATMIILDLLSHRKTISGKKKILESGSKALASNLFEEGKALIPEQAEMNAANIEKSLNTLENEFKKGGKRASRTPALEKLSELKNDIKDGKIKVSNLYEYRPAINEAIEELGAFEISSKKRRINQRAIKNLQKVKSEVIKGLEEYGESQNPEFFKISRAANEAWAVYEKSNAIGNFIERHGGNAVKSLSTKLALGIPFGGAVGSLLSPLGGGVAASTLPLYQAFKFYYRIRNSSTLRKYYLQVLEGASKGNAAQVSRNLKALDQKLLEEEKSEEKNQ